MTEKEKMFLVYCLLYDIRLDWNSEQKNISRAELASNLCMELGGDFIDLKFTIDTYLQELYNGKSVDGRIFRDGFPKGYCGMDKLYPEITNKLTDKSTEFQEFVKKYIYNPQYIFQIDSTSTFAQEDI